jgi:molybdopterin molybdotransferase
MLTLEQAQAQIEAGIRRARASESVSLEQACGRYLASDTAATVGNPAFDNSAMDGYAVHAADLPDADFRLPLQGESRCGDPPKSLAAGTTMRIFTGAPMPDGADTVVIQEDIHAEGGSIHFPRTVLPGQNVRRAGEDFAADEALFARGRRLNARDIALLSAAGVATPQVLRPARALVFATGDELVAPGVPLKPGQIYESNRIATLLQLRDLGCVVDDGGTVADDPDAVREQLQSAGDYDFVITSGGVSVGDYDLVKQVFAEIGEIEFWKVRIKPGKPLAHGYLGERGHFFGLPGNPVSSLVTFELFVRPAVIAWHHGADRRMALRATAVNEYRRSPGRTEFVRARLSLEDGELKAMALPGQGSHMLGTLRQTNALIRVEQDCDGFAAGDVVTVLPLSVDLA